MLEVISIGCIWKANTRARIDRNTLKDMQNDYSIEKQNAIYKLDNH